MIEREKRSKRRREITNVIAPEMLSNWQRKIVLSRLAQLCAPMLKGYQDDLPLLTDSLEQRLNATAQNSAQTARDIQITYRQIRKNKMLTDAPYAAALCAPWLRIDDNEKYAEWLGLIVLCCCQLHIIGQHDSAIDSALREIRLIANDINHAPIFHKLPRVTHINSLEKLGEQLEVLKLHYPEPNLEHAGIGYLSVVIRNAFVRSRGIVRRRKKRALTFSEPEVITVIPLEPVDDSGLEVERLQIRPENEDSRTVDETAMLETSVTFRVYGMHQRNKNLAIMAQQSQRFTEQLSSRNQSLLCSFEQLTDWDIHHLIQHCIANLKQQDSVACWVLLTLITGRDPSWLHTKARQHQLLDIVNSSPYIRMYHHVPASNQADILKGILPNISKQFERPLPQDLYQWVKKFNVNLPAPTLLEIRTWLSPVNKKHTTRLTLGRITRYLEHWCLNNGSDRAIVALMRGESHQSRPALAYSHVSQDAILHDYYRYVTAIFAMANINPQLPSYQPEASHLGSRLHLPSSILHHIFTVLAQPLKHRSNIWDFHNHYVCYVWALLTFSTGHRDVTAPMGKLTDYNPHQRTWWISDKERRNVPSARTLVIPPTAAKQVDDYLQHLHQLKKHCHFRAPNIAERCQQALDGSGNLLFYITDKQYTKVSSDLTPALLAKLLEQQLPWARNWARHHLRSELAKKNVYPEVIDGWMGHEEIGEEAFGQHSFLSMYEYRELADTIESILNTHKIEALSGWSTH